MKKIILLVAALCCFTACRKAAAPEPAAAPEAAAPEAAAADNKICNRTPLAEFAPAPADTDGSFTHLIAYLEQVHKCVLDQKPCDDAVQCLSQISNDTLLAAADDIQRDARIVREMETTEIMKILQMVTTIYNADICDAAFEKYESIDETVIHTGYYESSLLSTFYPYLIEAAQKKDCEAIKQTIRDLPGCIYANANIDFITLRDERSMGLAGLNYQMLHYNYMFKRLTRACGMTPEFFMAAAGISADNIQWDKSTGTIPEFDPRPMDRNKASQGSGDQSPDADEHEYFNCSRKPLTMIPATPGKQGDERIQLAGFQSTVLNCMLKPCDEAVSCIQEIPESLILAIIEDLKSDAYAKYDEKSSEDQVHLYTNPHKAIYMMAACDQALDAFEKINLRIIQSYGYANSTYLNTFWGNQLKATAITDCEKAALKMRADFDICAYGNAKLDKQHIIEADTGIPGFVYQILSYGSMIQRLDEKNGCNLLETFMMLDDIMDEITLTPGQDGVDIMDDTQPNRFRLLLPDEMFAPPAPEA